MLPWSSWRLEGYLTRSRQGTQVVPLAACREEAVKVPPVVLPERLQGLPAAMRRDSPALLFTPGMPAVNYFPLPLWRRLMDNVLRDEGSALLAMARRQATPCCGRLSLVIWRSPGGSVAIFGRLSLPKGRWKG
ncbi:GntR family transcriptional regulator [Klebsiella aerogenes]|nr:GntR family transcriptional regulator [Klebsiella aerogenes]